ncbi:MAG: TSUP family transporter [Tissierellales bacterium]|jgi:uncharacterized membrane protein YfcA|nr:TSUP family transporter [Tissierellales bacterium]
MIYLVICVAGFLGAMVDAMVGGGGLITLPALISTGMPIHIALGTNKFSASCGAISSVIHYYKSGTLNERLMKILIPCTFIGSVIGVNTVLMINPNFLKALVIVMVVIIGVYTLVNKNLGIEYKYEQPTKKKLVKGGLLSSIVGFYDGFFGPGAGSFYIFSLIKVFGLDFKHAAGNGKTLNATSNIAALVIFLFSGNIKFEYAIPMAISMIIGARVGTMLALKNGSKFIKPVFVIVSFVLVAKMGFELIV